MNSLVASDLDGTLLNQHQQITSYTRSVLKQLPGQGIQFAFATGRHHLDVGRFRDFVDIPAYLITSNGACIHDPDGNVMYQGFIPDEICADIVNVFAHQTGIRIHLYDPSGWLCSEFEPLMIRANKQNGFFPRLFDLQKPPFSAVFKMFVTCSDPDLLAHYSRSLAKRFGEQVIITSSGPYILEFNASGDSKGEAIRTVANDLGIKMNSTMAFGDSMNDQSMLQVAGKAFTMQNADPRLVRAMPDLPSIGHHAEDGVAKFLSSHVLGSAALDYE